MTWYLTTTTVTVTTIITAITFLLACLILWVVMYVCVGYIWVAILTCGINIFLRSSIFLASHLTAPSLIPSPLLDYSTTLLLDYSIDFLLSRPHPV